jgi:hypothetical protein
MTIIRREQGYETGGPRSEWKNFVTTGSEISGTVKKTTWAVAGVSIKTVAAPVKGT